MFALNKTQSMLAQVAVKARVPGQPSLFEQTGGGGGRAGALSMFGGRNTHKGKLRAAWMDVFLSGATQLVLAVCLTQRITSLAVLKAMYS